MGSKLVFVLLDTRPRNQRSGALSLWKVEAELKEVTNPHSLGVHLEVPPEVLKTIERDHEHDVVRQRTEVITYWLRNCADASWSRLAAVVEKVGGHGLLVERLRKLGPEQTMESEHTAADPGGWFPLLLFIGENWSIW